VRGFGPRTAARLLTAVGGVREAFDDLDAGGDRVTAAVGPAAAARLSDPAAREAWELNRQAMAMRSDVAIDLGAGHLPFPADEVRATFAALDLPWTAATALRVLAHDESAPPPSPRPPLETGWGQRPVRKRLPARPVSNQLTLF